MRALSILRLYIDANLNRIPPRANPLLYTIEVVNIKKDLNPNYFDCILMRI
jgi:hypothetical protein